MARLLTASDRSALIRLAASMPVGDKNRRSILTMLKQAMGPQAFAPVIRTFGDEINTPMEDRDVAVLTEAFVEMFQSYVERMVEIDSDKKPSAELTTGVAIDVGGEGYEREVDFDYPGSMSFEGRHDLPYTDILEGLRRKAPPHLRDAIKDKHRELGKAMHVHEDLVGTFCSGIVLNVFNKRSSYYTDNAGEYCKDNAEIAFDHMEEFGLSDIEAYLSFDPQIVDVETDKLVIYMSVTVNASLTQIGFSDY